MIRRVVIQYPADGEAFEEWYEKVKAADWKSFSEMKRTFNSVDSVGNDRYVFNIKGNQYRLIALIIFKVRTVFILFAGTHADYDRIDAKRITFKK
jgi:mRNA interferase HigB